MESSLPVLFHLAVASTLRALSRQAVELILLESYPQALVSLTRTHLVPVAQALVVTIPPVLVAHLALALVTIPPVLVAHLALALVTIPPVLVVHQAPVLATIPPVLVVHRAPALVSTPLALVAHLALAPESTHPVLASSLPSFPHPGALSQADSTQPVPTFQQWLRGAVSDSKRDNCEGCIDGRNAFAMRGTDRNRRLPAQGHGKILTTFGVLGIFIHFSITFHISHPRVQINRQA